MQFALTRLRSDDRDSIKALEAISANDDAVIRPASRWGIFRGLFGLASNELFLISVGNVDGIARRLQALDLVCETETLLLEPTIRPTNDKPLTREGLYVFRFFEVDHQDVDEIVALSGQAWLSFEDGDAYAAEPQALFCQTDRSTPRGRMLLLTWYDGLTSWQTSRKPAPEAVANFKRRHQLTAGTIAYATQLVP